MKKENTTKPKSHMPQIGESVFDIGYLLFDLIAAVLFFTKAADRPLFTSIVRLPSFSEEATPFI